jgi:hypothetical protein
MTIIMPTRRNVSRDGQSSLRGDILHLREWGSERRHSLSATAMRGSLGSHEDCAVRVSDPDVFPLHARLSREPRQWMLRALGDAAGVWCDGTRITLCSLEPGMEIRVGQTRLIAEDRGWVALRAFCARLLGWASDRRAAVDQALCSIRMCLTHRAPLLLQGDSDMVPIAHALHRRVLGQDRPFIVCDPRRGNQRASARSPANRKGGLDAFRAARGGSLCVRPTRLPHDFSAIMLRLRRTDEVQYVVCTAVDDDANPLLVLPAPIQVPPLASRAGDLDRIVDEYAADAIAELHARAACFTRTDRQWILEHAVSLAEIEKATMRVVALRMSRNLSEAAARLGLAPVSLWRWILRRKLPTFIPIS